MAFFSNQNSDFIPPSLEMYSNKSIRVTIPQTTDFVTTSICSLTASELLSPAGLPFAKSLETDLFLFRVAKHRCSVIISATAVATKSLSNGGIEIYISCKYLP